jgi:hypothetical protein
MVLHTVCLGTSGNTALLDEAAEKGKGSFNIIYEDDIPHQIDYKVVETLHKVQEPALEDCRLIWEACGKVIEDEKLYMLFRNSLTQR